MPHPSERIRGGRSQHLAGRRVVLGVSGSIAAIEAPRIARELIRHGAEVVAVMTREATRIVTGEAMSFATGHPAILELSGNVEHVSLLGPGEGRADLLLIAPATANTLSKIAHGIDDTPVTTCASVALGGGVPILLAPAMHAHMGQNPAIQENLQKLTSWGIGIVPPVEAEGEEKIAPPDVVAAAVVHRLARGAWAGRSLLVIGGASREPIDAVRSITNESSGETALALATEAYYRGAEVELWSGAMQRTPPPFMPNVRWKSVGELLRLASDRSTELRTRDAIVVPAALSDFGVEPRAGKIPSAGIETLTLTLSKLPKVLPELRRRAGSHPKLVGFKLESGRDATELARRAGELLAAAGLDAVVANDAAVLGSDHAEALYLDRRGDRRWLKGTKGEVAAGILDALGAQLPERAGGTPGTGAPPRHARRPPARRRNGSAAARRRRAARSS